MTAIDKTVKSIRIVVTGEGEDLDRRLPTELGYNGLPLEWITVPVLKFEKLKVDEEMVRGELFPPPDWIIFTSQRAVRFWSELLLQMGVDFPLETQVACIGEKTAEAANQDGFTPDFYPTEPGSEKFLEEFEDLISNNSIKPRVLMPTAEGGRTMIPERLKELGCSVKTIPLYRTMAREDVGRVVSQEEIGRSSMIVFTSPSSVDAFIKSFSIPDDILVASLGKFTCDHLAGRGIESRIVPSGDFERVGELLC